MKPKRQFSCKKNFHIKTNDVFNVEAIPQKSLNEIKRGKKLVENIKGSNFNGISLNFDYNKMGNDPHKEPPSDGRLRRFSNLRNKENHLTNIYSPVSINQYTRPVPQAILSKPLENSGKVWSNQPMRSDTIQYIKDNQIVKLNSINDNSEQQVQKLVVNKICPENQISFGIKNDSINYHSHQHDSPNNYWEKENHSTLSQKDRMDHILKTENQALNRDKQIQYDSISNSEANIPMNLPIQKSSRNFIASSMRKDFNNLAQAYNLDVSNLCDNEILQPQLNHINFKTQMPPIQPRPRIYSAEPFSSINTNVSEI